MGDRFFVILTWIVLLAFVIGALRYGRVTVDLVRSFFGFFYSMVLVLAGLIPGGPNAPSAPTYPAYNVGNGP